MPEDQRRLVVSLFADIAGYTALMQEDEQLALASMARFKEVLEKLIPESNGKLVQFYGDGCLSAFESAVGAVECARNLQRAFLEGTSVPVRIGIHLGDAVFRDGNVFGDSVNIASRIESMGVPGSVLMSAAVQRQIRNQEGLHTISLGEYHFKNVEIPMEVFALDVPGLKLPDKNNVQGKFADAPPKRRKPLPFILLILTLFLAGYFIVEMGSNEPPTQQIRTLGVLPFDIVGDDSSLDYLAEGIPENLINRMSGVGEFNVLSRHSTFSLPDNGRDLQRVKKVLPADLVLMGTISQVQNSVVLNCQLVDLTTGNQVWGRKLRNAIGDIFALEDSIVTALERPLKFSMRNRGDQYVPNPEAYTHYLKGRMLMYGSSFEETDQALDHFRKAVEIDENFALAWTGIAKVKYVAAMFGNTTDMEFVREARSATQRALQLEPDLLEAHLAEANIRFYLEHDWSRAEEAFKEAARIDPRHVDLNVEYAYFENMMGRFEHARQLADVALESDPISTASLHMAAWTRLFTEEYEDAADLLDKALELHPNWAWGWLKYGIAQSLMGNCHISLDATRRTDELVEEWGSTLIQAYISVMYAFCDDQKNATIVYDRIMARVDSIGPDNPFALAAVHVGMQDKVQALNWARRTVREKGIACYAMHTIPILPIYPKGIFDSPEYLRIIAPLEFPKP